MALDVRDAARGDESLETLVQTGDDAVLVRVDSRHVDALERAAHAELRALAGAVGELGRVEQRLGGDAPVVQAGAAEPARLDERDVETELGGTQRGGVAGAASAQDDDVEWCAGFGHVRLLQRGESESGRPRHDGGPDGNR
ncbi:Uncharacterised protein [Mycobacteroides abscessus]|nr:Uncharacterised protein [Mycobacteroides abscessus]